MTNKKGFTIVELVIVIAVIAILAAVLIPTFSSVISKANQSAAQSACKNALEIVLAQENPNDSTTYGKTAYAFKSGDYYCIYTPGSALSEATKTAPTGYTAKSYTGEAKADLDKLGVTVSAKTVTAPSGT